MKTKNWIVTEDDRQAARQLAETLGITELTARVLMARGISEQIQAQAFFDKSHNVLRDPFLLPDMDKAVDIIERAIKRSAKIAIFGDYDVDGITATCILMRYLKGRNVDCVYHIPDRLDEGYGLNKAAVSMLKEQGVQLMITVDSGITAIEEIAHARALGIEVIVTDHHECKEQLPDAHAIVNPRREDNTYPFRDFAGVGVAFKLVCALEKDASIEHMLDRFSDIAALGTVADMMPIVDENRSIVNYGLLKLQTSKNPGLNALINKLGFDRKSISTSTISFAMAPRINAAGRLGAADLAAQLFLTDDADKAAQLADNLCELNRQRQEQERSIFEQVDDMIKSDPEVLNCKLLTLWGEGWHNGVLGIVASRISEKYGVPCVLISLTGDQGKGSGRSIKGFNLYAALQSCTDLFDKHGGHELAVGLTINRHNIPELKQRLLEYAEQADLTQITKHGLTIDCVLKAHELTKSEIGDFDKLMPFGMGNPQPCFAIYDMKIEEITPISFDRHTRFTLSSGGINFGGVIFGMGSKSCPFAPGDKVDVAFAAEINTFRGVSSVQMVIRDIKWSQSEIASDDNCIAAYKQFGNSLLTEHIARLISPTGIELRALFRYIRSNAEDGVLRGNAASIYRKVRYESRSDLNYGSFFVCMDVFSEFDIFSYNISGNDIEIKLVRQEGKADINGSTILKALSDAFKE